MATTEEGYARLRSGALYYGSLGWKIIPVHGVAQDGRCTCGEIHTDPKDIAKHPAVREWQHEASSDPTQIDSWWDRDYRFNAGVFCRDSGFLVIDIDPRSGGFESFAKFENRLGENGLVPTVEAITGAYTHQGKMVRGRHIYYGAEQNEEFVGNLKGMKLPGIDIKHNGYIMLNPSNHLSGVEYEWKPGHAPWEIALAPAPEELLSVLRKSRRRGNISTYAGGEDGWTWVGNVDGPNGKLDLGKFFDEGVDEGSRAIDIFAMACSLANRFGTDAIGRDAVEKTMMAFNYEKVRPPLPLEGTNSLMMHVHRAIEFVAAHPKEELQQGHTYTAAQEYIEKHKANVQAPSPSAQVPYSTSDPDDEDDVAYVDTFLAGTIGGQVHEIANSGRSVKRRALDMPKDTDALTAEEGGDPSMRSLSDLGNGRRFVDAFGAVIRYTPGLGWFNWSGGYWMPDTEDLGTKEYAKRLSSIIAREVVNYEDNAKQSEIIKWANEAKSNRRQNNTLESATSDPRIAVNVDSWDSDPTLFGCLNGVIDLRTGELMRGRPDLYITRRGPVAYTPGLRNPRWEEFLDFATGGDKEYQAWLQRAVGYTLTGLRTHDVMFLMYGPAGTGKNVFTEAVVKVMGTQEYAWPMDSQILAQGDGQAHSSDLYHWAQLRGRRMVWIDEFPESERLKENSVKKLTGSSEISARSPGEKPFSFLSQAKLWATTNHRPIINDDAMWRRIRPIPWLNVPSVPDPGLKEYIFDPEGGLPGVLAWAVEGAMTVLNSKEKDTLGWCKVVKEAADVYRKNEDRIGMFLDEETNDTPGTDLPLRALFVIYQVWSGDRGEKPMSQIAFQRKLSDRGLDVSGQGSRAEIRNKTIKPRVQSASPLDWSNLARGAR